MGTRARPTTGVGVRVTPRVTRGVTRWSSGRARRGASLIEILLACTLMTVAIVGLLGTSRKISEMMGTSRRQLIAASVAQARLDSLQSLSCTSLTALGAGSRTTRGIIEAWTITEGTNSRFIALTLTIPRMAQKLTYTTIVPCV